MEDHFSHQHALLALQLEEGDKVDHCQGCEEQISDPILVHGCLSCDFYLHDSCTNAPRFLNHPSHPLHPLTLLPTPTYTSRSYGCNACGSHGKAFSYSCACCEFDLHLKCASMPNPIVVKAHKHELELVFDSSYEQKDCVFTCDLCERVVNTGQWVYYCKACDFGTHLGCVEWKGYLEKGLCATKGKDTRTNSNGDNAKYVRKQNDENKGKSSNDGNVEKEEPSQEQYLQKEISKAQTQTKMEELRQELDIQKEIFEAQRKMREQTIANQIVLEALDNAADYVGPSYTRRYYYY